MWKGAQLAEKMFLPDVQQREMRGERVNVSGGMEERVGCVWAKTNSDLTLKSRPD